MSDTEKRDDDAEGAEKDAEESSDERVATSDESGASDEGDVTATVPDMPAAKRRSDAPDEPAAEEPKKPARHDSAPPKGPISFRYFGLTEVGLVREHNEDNFAIVELDTETAFWGGEDDPRPIDAIHSGELGPKGLILAVCDGMGGAAAGEVASKMAVDTIREVMLAGGPPSDRDVFAHRLVHSIEEAGARIFGAAKMDRSRRGMGTTATVAGFVDRMLFIGNVGDSRCYVLRGGELTLITKDQSLVNQLIEAGQLTEEEAEAFEHSNIILQALGTTEEVSVDLTFLELRQGDRLMLCSDGLSGLVHQEMIKDVLADGDDLEAIARRLAEMACAGGGHDNITCVVADVGGEGLAPSNDTKAFYQQYPLPESSAPRPSDVPPREPTMKTSSRKPGADVKKREAIDYDGDAPTIPAPRFPWGLFLSVLIVGALVAAYAIHASDGEGNDEVVPVIPDPEPEPVEVCVRTDVIEGELFVDNQSYGPLRENETICLELLPGFYRFEARSGGTVVARARPNIRAGVATDVELRLPEGATRPQDAGDPAEGEPAPGEDATMAAEPAPGDAPTGEGTPSSADPATMAGSTSETSMTATSATTTMTSTEPSPTTTMTSSTSEPSGPSPMTTTTTMASSTSSTSSTSETSGAEATAMTSTRTSTTMTTTAMTSDDGVPSNPF